MYYGDPVGHWDGDTLVVDTTNFNRWALDDYYYTNQKEYRMHSDAFHTISELTAARFLRSGSSCTRRIGRRGGAACP